MVQEADYRINLWFCSFGGDIYCSRWQPPERPAEQAPATALSRPSVVLQPDGPSDPLRSRLAVDKILGLLEVIYRRGA